MALTSLVFFLGYLGGLALCVIRGPIWGLYTYVAVFYLHPPSRWWGMYLPGIRWSLLAAAVTLVCVLARRQGSSRPPFTQSGIVVAFIAYVVWMWIQTPFVISGEHVTGTVLFTKYVLLIYLIYVLIDSPERLRDFLLAHVVGCFYLGWLVYTAPEGGGRLEGVGGPGIDDANTMSMHFGTGVVVAAVLLLTEKKWRFWLTLAAIPFMLNGMVQGGSRGAFLGLVAGGLTLFWLKPPAYRKQFYAFAALGLLLFGYLANDVFLERLSTLGAVTSEEKELDQSAYSRIVVIKAQWEMFFDYPLGAGHAGTTVLSPQYIPAEYLTRSSPNSTPVRASHNTFMSVVVDQGIVGIVILVALLTAVCRTVGDVTKRSGQSQEFWAYGSAIAAALMVAAVAGQFAPYLKAEVQIWMLALLVSAKSMVAHRIEHARESSSARPRVLASQSALEP